MRETQLLNRNVRNPLSEATHRREVLWQITIPFALGVILILAVAIVVGIGGTAGGNVSLLADLSLIWLIIPALIAMLIFTILLSAILYGVIRLIGVLPYYALRTLDFLQRVQSYIRKGADVAAAPVVRVHGVRAALRRLFR